MNRFKYLLPLVFLSSTLHAEDEEMVFKILSIVFGEDEVLSQMPIDDLNENVDLLIDDLNNGKVYTEKSTNSRLRQISDLFIDCERDHDGNISIVKLIRVIEADNEYSVRMIAQLDESYCRS